MKTLAQPTRSFFTLKISWKSSSSWLQLVFHFGTENGEGQLKKTPCRTECWQLPIVRCSKQPESPRLARSTTAGQQLLLCWHVEDFLQSHRGHVQSFIPTHRFSDWPVWSDRSAVAAFGGLVNFHGLASYLWGQGLFWGMQLYFACET